MQVFVDNDTGYVDWLARHPRGLVVNADRHPKPGYLVLHKATCPRISRTSRPYGAWTHRSYIKACSEQIADLEKWARDEAGGTLQPCGHCHPV